MFRNQIFFLTLRRNLDSENNQKAEKTENEQRDKDSEKRENAGMGRK